MLNYAISPDSASSVWLAVTPASGVSTGEHDRIQINYSAAVLPIGSYTSLISIVSADATNSPQIVKVVMAVVPLPPGPTIACSPSAFPVACTSVGTPAATFLCLERRHRDSELCVELGLHLALDGPTGGSITNPAIVTPGGGNPTVANRIQVNYATASLGLGTYTGLITITSAEATNSPADGEGDVMRWCRRRPAPRLRGMPRRISRAACFWAAMRGATYSVSGTPAPEL